MKILKTVNWKNYLKSDYDFIISAMKEKIGKVRANYYFLRNSIKYLSRPSLRDWSYNLGHLSKVFKLGVLGGLEELQRNNEEVGFTSTPSDGIAAGFTGTGVMSTLLSPHTGHTHQIPYYENSKSEGGFAGLEIDGERLLFPNFDVNIGYVGQTGILKIEYKHELVNVIEYAYVYPGKNTLFREFEVENKTDKPIKGNFLYYLKANANDNYQNFIVWNSSENSIRESDNGLIWEDEESPYELHVGFVNKEHLSETDFPRSSGYYIPGLMKSEFSVGPEENFNRCVMVSGNGTPNSNHLPDTMDERLWILRNYWESYIEDIDTSTVPDGLDKMYLRCVVVISMLYDPISSSIIASPNLRPSYHFSWIRDGAFCAVAMAKAGKTTIAKNYLSEFCKFVQEPNGSFKQCYDSLGNSAGLIELENDQQPIYAWAVHEVYKETGDKDFLRKSWPAVERSLEFTIDQIRRSGLLDASHGIAEFPESYGKSLWVNSFAYRGLKSGESLSMELAGMDRIYGDKAREVGRAIDRRLFKPSITERVINRQLVKSHKDIELYDSCILFPTEWAIDFRRIDESRDIIERKTENISEKWIPGVLMAASSMYVTGRVELGDHIMWEVFSEDTTQAGHLLEVKEHNGDGTFASPLAWSHAMFILAAEERNSTWNY